MQVSLRKRCSWGKIDDSAPFNESDRQFIWAVASADLVDSAYRFSVLRVFVRCTRNRYRRIHQASARGAFSRPRSVPRWIGVVRRSRVASHLRSPQGAQSARVVHHETRSRQHVELRGSCNRTVPSWTHALAPAFFLGFANRTTHVTPGVRRNHRQRKKDRITLRDEMVVVRVSE